MGTDIHMSVFKRRDLESPWVLVPGVTYDDRNYRVFAALAGVRNGTGFAGCKTGEPITPVAEPRGLPEDLHAMQKDNFSDHPGILPSDPDDRYEVIYEARKLKYGEVAYFDHTPSWLLLTEVLTYDWNQAVVTSGVVSVEGFREFMRAGRPRDWSGDVFGAQVLHIPAAEMLSRVERDDWAMWDDDFTDARTEEAKETSPFSGLRLPVRPLDRDKPIQFYTRVEWSRPLREICLDFVTWAEELPTKLEAEPDNIRLVFGFDS